MSIDVQGYVIDDALTEDDINKILCCDDWQARNFLAYRNDIELSPEQLERALTDENQYVRQSFAAKKGFTMTDSQIDRGLSDADSQVMRAVIVRPETVLTAARFSVVLRFFEKTGYVDKKILDDIAGKPHFHPDKAQLEWGMKQWGTALSHRCFRHPDALPDKELVEEAEKRGTMILYDDIQELKQKWEAKRQANELLKRVPDGEHARSGRKSI